jgi:probable addiction module antidote protein
MPRNVDYKADLLADLRDDLGFAAEYLSAAYADSQEAFLVALRDVAEAQKGITKVAAQAKVNRENLYRTLSRHGNPTLNTVGSVLDVLGLKVLIVPQEVVVTSSSGSDPLVTIARSSVPTQKATNITELTSNTTVFGLLAANTNEVNVSVGLSTARGELDEFVDTPLQWGLIAQAQKSEEHLVT